MNRYEQWLHDEGVLRLREGEYEAKDSTIIEKVDPLTGKSNKVVLSCTKYDISGYVNSGMDIQDALPQLNADEREFIMTGIVPDSWEKFVVGEEE